MPIVTNLFFSENGCCTFNSAAKNVEHGRVKHSVDEHVEIVKLLLARDRAKTARGKHMFGIQKMAGEEREHIK